MIITYKKTAELVPYDKNAKLHDEKQIKNVANSISRFGWQQPIVIDENGVVVIGHCRLEAAKKLKLKEVPVTVASGLTDDEIKELRIADNKTNESPWDLGLLAEDIEGLSFDGFDFEMPDVEIGGGMDDKNIVEDDFDAQLPQEPKAKVGDIYQLGRHRLMCGSSTSVDDVETLTGGASIDLVYTDPPYGMSAVSKSGVLSEKYKTDIMNDEDNTVAIDSFNLSAALFGTAKQVWWGGRITTPNVFLRLNAGLFGIKTTVQAIKQTANLLGQILEALCDSSQWQVKKQTVSILHKSLASCFARL